MVMAIIYVKCGQYDKALDELEQLLVEQTNYTMNNFKMNMELAPLWKLPRYQEMIRKYNTISAMQ
jgi:tetratricopeptide (TPR) repeat protein